MSNDDTTDDRIVDSSLRLITTNNETSGTSGFNMERGMRKSDGKIEYRSKQNGGSNQTLYGRDQLSDSWDFEESDTEGWNVHSSATLTVSDGLLEVVTTGGADGIQYVLSSYEPELDSIIWHTLAFRAKTNDSSAGSYRAEFKDVDLTGSLIDSGVKSFGMTTEFQDYTVDISLIQDFFDTFEIETKNTETLDLKTSYEWIRLIGALEYSTNIDGEVEDSWNWADAEDYWLVQEDNISDFDDLTTEGYDNFASHTLVSTNSSGWLEVTSGVATAQNIINVSSLSIDADIYSWLTMEINQQAGGNITHIGITDDSANTVCSDTTNHALDETFLFSCNLDLDVDWAGTETGLRIYIDYFTGDTHITAFNFTFLFSQELGDLEGWSAGVSNKYQFVNPNGYSTLVSSGFTGFQTIGLSIDSSLFDYIEFRARATANITISSDSFWIAETAFQVLNTWTPTSSWQTFSFDFSENSNWDGTETVLRIGQSGAAIEFRLDIDYVLLLGHWEEPDSVIGLSNSAGVPVLNVTTHFWANDSLGGRFEIEMLDVAGEISHLYTSENYTNLGSEWIRGKIEYNVLKSSMTTTINWDNGSRVFRVSWDTTEEDFTTLSGRTPALFELGKSPQIFVSTYTASTSWQTLELDFIKAPFKEREWTRDPDFPAPSVSGWAPDSWNFAEVTNVSGSDTTVWKLIVPNLDSFSGTMRMQYNNTVTPDINSYALFGVQIFGVDGDDGELHLLAYFAVIFVSLGCPAPGACSPIAAVLDGDENTIAAEQSLTDDYSIDPILKFTFSLRDERSKIDLKARIQLDDTDDTTFSDVVSSLNVSDFVDDPSQEFVIKTIYQVDDFQAPNAKVTMLIDDFDLIERDIFQGVINSIIGTTGQDWNPFAVLFRFIAEVFRQVGDLIVFGIVQAITTLQTNLNIWIGNVVTAINNIQTWLTTLGTTITTALTTEFDRLNGWLTAVQNALITQLALIEAWLTTLKDGVVNAINNIETWLQTTVTNLLATLDPILSQLQNIWGVFETIIADFLSGFLTWIEDSFWALLTGTLLILLINAVLSFINTVITGIMAGAAFLLDAFLNLLPFGIGTYFVGFNNLNLTALFNQIFAMIDWILTFSLIWIMLFLGFYMFVFPIIQNGDNPGAVFGDMAHNAFSLHGFDFTTALGNITIPIRVNAFAIWLFIVIILGYLSWIIPFSLF